MDKVLNLREAKRIILDDLFTLNYTKPEVLESIDDRRVRRGNLDKAVTLGKNPKNTTRLVLATESGFVQVFGVVHFVNEKGITLEKDHFIPMHVIYSVDMF